MVAALLGVATPNFWLGLMLIIVFSLNLGWLPSGGMGSWKNYIMPAITLGTGDAALICRMTRSSMLEVIRQDYIRTARAKGVPEKMVIRKHALKNARSRSLPLSAFSSVPFLAARLLPRPYLHGRALAVSW